MKKYMYTNSFPENIINIFYSNVRNYPNKTALIFENIEFSYSRLAQEVSGLSEYLSKRGVKKNDRVGVLLPNCPEFVIIMLVAANLGITLIPQNMTLPAKLIIKTFKSINVKHIIAHYSMIHSLKQINNDFTIWISVGGASEYAVFYDEIIKNIKQSYLIRKDISPEQPYIVTLTSGSTGNPKPIILLQSTKISRVKSLILNYNIVRNNIILAATPLYHSLAQRLVLLPLLSGGTCVLMAGFTSDMWISKVKKYNITFTMAVSSQLKQIYRILEKQDIKLDSLHCLVSSSELLDVGLKKKLIKKLHCDFYECYGTSEVGCVTSISSKEIDKNLSVGKPIDGVDIKILRDDCSVASIGEVGEIVCKTSMSFSGYDKCMGIVKNYMWNGYFRTGDLGKLDDEGYLYFKGRKKDMIVTGGINVYPKDIEDILNAYDKILECAVIALPDKNLGEMVTAVIVAKDSILRIKELQKLCAKELADYQQPKRFIFVDQLPKNNLGKIVKYKLIEQYSKKQRFINE